MHSIDSGYHEVGTGCCSARRHCAKNPRKMLPQTSKGALHFGSPRSVSDPLSAAQTGNKGPGSNDWKGKSKNTNSPDFK